MRSASTPLLCLCLLVLPSCPLLLQRAHAAARHGGISLMSQQKALLHWKSTLANPAAEMSSWRDTSSSSGGLCNWTGIMCTAVRHGRSMPWAVTSISLPDAGIHGKLGIWRSQEHSRP
uniref:Leucine-rich repeat-containing N-terminal plant-type domain-containing protein n=1 Tax=Triticum urartu TaxID=4572 RepID=A0A8R7UU25_TRIUA